MHQVAGARGEREAASAGGEPGGAEGRGDARDPAEINQRILRSFLPLRSRSNGAAGEQAGEFLSQMHYRARRRAAIKLSRVVPPRTRLLYVPIGDTGDRRQREDAGGTGANIRANARAPPASRFAIRSRGCVLAFRSRGSEEGKKTGEERGRGALAPRHGARTRRRELARSLARSCAAQHAGLLMSASQSGNFSTSRWVMHEPRGASKLYCPINQDEPGMATAALSAALRAFSQRTGGTGALA